MADAKLTALGTATAVALADLFYIVRDVSGTPIEKKATGTQVRATIVTGELADIDTIGVTDGGFVVGDGANLVLETGATARTSLGVGTGDSPQFTAVNLGHASDTTLTRVSAGVAAVEGATIYTQGGALGTPASGTLTNCTGLPVSTGVSGLGSNVAAFLATPSSANLASAVTGETGSGALVFATSPTLVTPALGTPASGVATNITNKIVLGTTADLTNGGSNDLTSVTFSSLPSGIKQFALSIHGGTTNGATGWKVQIGPSGGVETSGYQGSAGSVLSTSVCNNEQHTDGFHINNVSASDVVGGSWIFTLVDATNHVWSVTGSFGSTSAGNNRTYFSAGSIDLSGELSVVTLSSDNDTDTFDGGSANIAYIR